MPTLTSANDLITAIPFLIGFHPTNSIVLISVKDGAIGLAMRIDLPERLRSEEIDLLAHHFLRDQSEAALLVAYMPGNRDDGDSILISLGAGLIRNGIDIQESIVVQSNRYRSIICRDQSCCPPSGKEMPEINASEIAAEHVMAGIPMPFENISQLIETLSPDPASLALSWASEVSSFSIDDDDLDVGKPEVISC